MERRLWGNRDEAGCGIGFAEGFKELEIRQIRWLLTARIVRYWSLWVGGLGELHMIRWFWFKMLGVRLLVAEAE
jgi:hypothetical protein